MGIFDFLKRKESITRQALVIGQVGQPLHTKRNYTAMADEGYRANVIVFRAIQIIAKAVAGVEWELYQTNADGSRTEIEKHELLDLLYNPNPYVGYAQFFENITAFLLMAGNSYLEFNAKGKKELWNVRPDYMSVIPGKMGLPAAYKFQCGNEMRIFDVNQINGRSAICHMRDFHPTDNWYGMSRLESAFLSVDQHNNAGRWNLSLLQRDARPSGALTVEMTEINPSGKLAPEQFTNLKNQITELYSGAKNSGRPMLLEGGLKWQQMSLNAKDMDFLNGKNLSAREIALAIGVPPLLLNISGDNTYNNLKEARLALYEETVLPIICLIKDEFQRWLVPMFGDNLELDYCKDSISGITLKRDMMFELANKGKDFLSINERRDIVGYPPIDGGDGLTNTDPAAADPNKDPATQNDKPVVEAEQPSQNTEDTQNGDGQKPVDEQPKAVSEQFHEDSLFDELKMVNVRSKTGKQRAARAYQRRKEALAHAFELDLNDVFEKMNKAMGTIKTTEAKLAEMQAAAIVADHEDDFSRVFQKHIRRAAVDFGRPILEQGKSFSPVEETKKEEWFYSWLNTFVKTHTANNVSKISGTSIKKAREKIKDIVETGIESGSSNVDIGKFLQDELSTLSDGRARTIARTEVAIASQTGSFEAAKAMEIPGMTKEWVSIDDDRTRNDPSKADHLTMNGKTVPINEKFHVPPDCDMDGPCDPTAPAEQIINCRCAVVFLTPEK